MAKPPVIPPSPAPPECSDGRYSHPSQRRLKVFSLDPAADVQLETSLISRSVLDVPWENVAPGPIGDYLEVLDVDPASDAVYEPVDLNHHSLLANDGLNPSTGNPQFHQQMVYAVAMKTIVNFEQVLGRTVMWSERTYDEKGKIVRQPSRRFVRRLRIYPHALRDQNAFYSPAKKALLFGYFNAPTTDPRDELPGGVVFTCLSHDIIAHETTHAILDGMHRRLLEASNADMRAFHEAFADIVAIFQHFTLPGLLLDQIERSRGDLRTNNLLAQLAAQFARSTGRGGALRNALGLFGPDGRQQSPDPAELGRTFEPHDRGAIMVAAVFDAFLRIYENRSVDLRRIASGGTGVLPAGDLHPDLARRLAHEAVEAAQRVLNICIRAVDYLPPVDVTFGDYLRALITADADFFPDDPKRYRLAFIQSFRDRGICPQDVRTLAEDALRWTPLDKAACEALRDLLPPPAVLRTMAYAYDVPGALSALLAGGNDDGDDDDEDDRDLAGEIGACFRKNDLTGATQRLLAAAWLRDDSSCECGDSERVDRFKRFETERLFARFLHGWIVTQARIFQEQSSSPSEFKDKANAIGWHFGIDIEQLNRPGKDRGRLEVHAVRPTIRLRPDGRSKVELLVMLTQKRNVKLPAEKDKEQPSAFGEAPLSYQFRGGSTIIIDPEHGCIRYAISKNLRSQSRPARQEAFLRDQIHRHGSAAIVQFGLTPAAAALHRHQEPFAFVHGQDISVGGY
ncbi:MAG TPA: hypothetical protein VMP01_01265 [Pirellulaceae bacterium]|nr:hypothetical protein [Pirellulaceae bacterium]